MTGGGVEQHTADRERERKGGGEIQKSSRHEGEVAVPSARVGFVLWCHNSLVHVWCFAEGSGCYWLPEGPAGGGNDSNAHVACFRPAPLYVTVMANSTRCSHI